MTAVRSLGGFAYLFAMVALTIYGQIIMKWQVTLVGASPAGGTEKLLFLGRMLLRPWVVSAFGAAFLASLCWMLALTKLPLSAAYPVTSLTFVGVILASALLFGEPLTLAKVSGMGLLVVGIALLGQK